MAPQAARVMRGFVASLLLACAIPAGVLAADPEVARLLERAEFWRDRARDDLAREELAKVFRLAPDHPAALAMLARIQLVAGQDRDVAATLDRLRAAHPGDRAVASIATLLRVRGPDREKLRQARQFARAGRADEAVQAYRDLFPEGFPDDEFALEYAQSLAATRNGRDAGSKLIAELAHQHPEDARFRVALAADQSWRKPVAPATIRALRELSGVPSVARQAREAWRRALLAMDPIDANLAPLREYVAENPGDTALQEKLQQVKAAIASGQKARDDPSVRTEREAEEAGAMGIERLREGRHDEALALFLEAQRIDPKSRARWANLERTSRYWGLLGKASAARAAGTFDVARSHAQEAIALDRDEAEGHDELARIEAAVRAARVDALRDDAKRLQAAKQDAQAVAALEEAATLDPDNPWILHELGRLDAARAEERFKRLLERRPADGEARYALALVLSAAGRDADALAVVETIAPGQRSEGANALRIRVQASIRSREAQALADASRTAQREGQVDRAVELEMRALAVEPSEETWRVRRLAELRDQQLGWTGGALDVLHRSGTAGKSRLDAQELALGYRQAWTSSGRAFVRIAPSRIESGTLDLSNAFEASTYGSLLTCRPDCSAAPLAASRSGVALGAGTQFGAWRIDAGATPLGFPVVNVVGGALYEASAGDFSYSIDVARRPVATSLLSYAGSRDPNTGRTWGGVVATGVRVNVSRDRGGDYGAWGLAGGYRLTGKSVRDNDKAELMAGGYRRVVNEENRQLMAGVTAMFWHFSENAGEFTLGHGGYYSPRRYESLAFPVTFAMRAASTSYYARASVSVSRSTSWRAAYFPLDPQLQAQAEALAPVTGIDPFYAGGDNGRGFGRSFSAAAEHRLAPDLFIGARVDIERSTNYTPNRLLLYARMSIGGATSRPIAMPPEPVVLPGFQF